LLAPFFSDIVTHIQVQVLVQLYVFLSFQDLLVLKL